MFYSLGTTYFKFGFGIRETFETSGSCEKAIHFILSVCGSVRMLSENFAIVKFPQLFRNALCVPENMHPSPVLQLNSFYSDCVRLFILI